MMAADPTPRLLSVAEYLQLDDANPDTKYEYYDGFVRMMSGGTLDHAEIAANLITALKNALRGRNCRVFTSDARVQVSVTQYVYPDVSVSCAAEDRGKITTVRSPCLVFEVLSPSNAAFDRGPKADFYRDCPSIEEYVLVDAERPLIEVYRRAELFWQLRVAKTGDILDLASIGVQISLADVYGDITFSTNADPTQ